MLLFPLRATVSASRCAAKLLLGIALFFLGERGLDAYILSGPKWAADSTVTFQLSLGAAGRTLLDGTTSWDTAAAPAFDSWDQSLLHVQFVPHTASSSASSGDRINTIAFASTVFGQSFGSNTLAVTYYRYSNSTMSEADVLFNVNQTFDSYRGPLRFGSNGWAIADIRRVLIHELGHALGLNHPDQNGQQIDAIMNSVISDREIPSSDDLAGGQSLYGARVPASPAIVSATRLTNGHVLLQCTGAPNAINRIEVSSDLSQGFTTLTSVTVDGSGQFQFEDNNSAAFENRFYRIAYP
jgi:matrixin